MQCLLLEQRPLFAKFENFLSLQLSSEQNPGWLGHVGGYTTCEYTEH